MIKLQFWASLGSQVLNKNCYILILILMLHLLYLAQKISKFFEILNIISFLYCVKISTNSNYFWRSHCQKKMKLYNYPLMTKKKN